MSARKPKPVEFEHSLAELESLVERLEHGDLPLEDALKQFERGMELARHCEAALLEAEQRVEILLQKTAEAEPQPFEPETDT